MAKDLAESGSAIVAELRRDRKPSPFVISLFLEACIRSRQAPDPGLSDDKISRQFISQEGNEVMLDHAKKLEGIIQAQDEQILALKRLIYLETKVLKLKGVGK